MIRTIDQCPLCMRITDGHKSITAKVLLLNDEEATMEFVVQVLESIFGKTRDEALKLVVDIHHNGRGECGAYTLTTQRKSPLG